MIFAIIAASLGILPPSFAPGEINPDVTQTNIQQTICKDGWTKTIRPPASYTDSLKRKQLMQLGVTADPKSVEEDHRVPLELGGNPTDPQNLYPEPWAGDFGAHRKDRLETEAKHRVCKNTITLEQARTIFLGDWTQTYVQWFGKP